MDFCKAPTSADFEKFEECSDDFVVRSSKAQYCDSSQRFRIADRNFKNQYFEIYSHRLKFLRDQIIENINKKWKDHIETYKICPKILHANEGKCILVGTLMKEMPLLPRVLDEFTEKAGILPQPEKNNFISAKDVLILEDETGRVTLTGPHNNIGSLATGMVVGVRGTLNNAGELVCEEYCFAGSAPQPAHDPSAATSQQPEKFVAFVCGLNLKEDPKNRTAISLMVDFLMGRSGSKKEKQFAASIERLVIAGSSLAPPEVNTLSGPILGKKKAPIVVEPLEWFDKTLFELCSVMKVDIMPGLGDPVNSTVPQQPFNPVLFPMASRYTTIHAATNPYEFSFDNTFFLGNSGQITSALQQYVTPDISPLDLLSMTLEQRHIAPIAPDVLPTYPFDQNDPFIIEKTPHVCFSGNAENFQSRLQRMENGDKVRLLVLPKFDKTHTLYLVSTSSLEVHPICFMRE